MKRIYLVLLAGLFLLSCSYTILLPTNPTVPASSPSAMLTETAVVTSTFTPSVTPTVPTPTFTSTPTLIYTGPTATPSDTPMPTATLGVLGQNNFNLSTPDTNPYFSSIQFSSSILYWGIHCQSSQPTSISFKVHIVENPKIKIVLLFYRLVDKTTPTKFTDWGGGAIMNGDGSGTFVYTIPYKSVSGYPDYKNAWFQYQFIAAYNSVTVIGRSEPYLHNVSFVYCQ